MYKIYGGQNSHKLSYWLYHLVSIEGKSKIFVSNWEFSGSTYLMASFKLTPTDCCYQGNETFRTFSQNFGVCRTGAARRPSGWVLPRIFALELGCYFVCRNFSSTNLREKSVADTAIWRQPPFSADVSTAQSSLGHVIFVVRRCLAASASLLSKSWCWLPWRVPILYLWSSRRRSYLCTARTAREPDRAESIRVLVQRPPGAVLHSSNEPDDRTLTMALPWW